jgi:hypothetical protein
VLGYASGSVISASVSPWAGVSCAWLGAGVCPGRPVAMSRGRAGPVMVIVRCADRKHPVRQVPRTMAAAPDRP